MRIAIFFDKSGWLYKLDYKKAILIALLLRVIFACSYDVYVSVTDRDFLLPDSKFYSIKGRYVSLLLEGNGIGSFTRDMVPLDQMSQAIFIDILKTEKGQFPSCKNNEGNVYSYLVGAIYFIFGYATIWIRLFSIFLSIAAAYLLFMIGRRHFGVAAANLFLLVALFLPTQFGYSITLSRDFMRMFVISLILWVIYG